MKDCHYLQVLAWNLNYFFFEILISLLSFWNLDFLSWNSELPLLATPCPHGCWVCAVGTRAHGSGCECCWEEHMAFSVTMSDFLQKEQGRSSPSQPVALLVPAVPQPPGLKTKNDNTWARSERTRTGLARNLSWGVHCAGESFSHHTRGL